MVFPPRQGDGFVTAQEILDNLPVLALPHFQRGRVWDNTGVSMLMESLTDGTPCGSIILWRPPGRIGNHGERPGDWAQRSPGAAPKYLVVDGQQRLTALNALFHADWAVNLAAFPQLGLPRHRIESHDPFVPWPGEPASTAGPTTRDNYRLRTRHLVPLASLMGEHMPELDLQIDPQEWSRLIARIRAAGQRRFHVLVKQRNSLSDIVGLYNRINSSGVPVRKEERAYAALVAVDRAAPDWLRMCFEQAHPHEEDPDRNAVLKRQRERLFGFPLFIAAYTQTVGFHRDLKGDLDLLARETPDLTWASKPRNLRAMREDSQNCIQRTAHTLRERLLCDDLRFLPSAEPLRLAFAVLLRYPQTDEATLARVILLGQVNRITGRSKPGRIERLVLDSNTLGQAIDAFPTVPAMLGDQLAFERRLRTVDSMNDPWVSLMYWYQRGLSSCDYLPASKGAGLLPLNRDAAATKEHIVPFSWLYRHYDLDPRGHSARHGVNAIGNLTMISADLNYAHGSDPVELARIDPALLRPHSLDDPRVLSRYASAITAIRSDAGREKIQQRYERFLRARSARLAAGMYDWLLTTCDQDLPQPGQQPRARLLNPSPTDILRSQHGLPPGVREQLLTMGIRSDAPYWLLHRVSGRNTRADKIRISRDGHALRVGLAIPGIQPVTDDLDALAPRITADGHEVQYALPARGPRAEAALQRVARFLHS